MAKWNLTYWAAAHQLHNAEFDHYPVSSKPEVKLLCKAVLTHSILPFTFYDYLGNNDNCTLLRFSDPAPDIFNGNYNYG